MAITVTDVNTLRAYINGVMDRADHHAGRVNEIALALAGAILWRMGDQPIKVMERGGEAKNVLWFSTSKGRYAFAYDHAAGVIELRKDSVQGDAIHLFTNDTPLAEVRAIFQKL